MVWKYIKNIYLICIYKDHIQSKYGKILKIIQSRYILRVLILFYFSVLFEIFHNKRTKQKMKNVKLIKVLNKVVNSCLTNIWHIHTKTFPMLKFVLERRLSDGNYLDGVLGETRLETLLWARYFLDQIKIRECSAHAEGPWKPARLGRVCWGPLSPTKDATASSRWRLLRSRQRLETAPITYITEGPSMRRGRRLMREHAGERWPEALRTGTHARFSDRCSLGRTPLST